MNRASNLNPLLNGLVYLLPLVASSVVSLATLPVFTRVLTPEEYGAWALATAYGAFANGVSNFGLTVGFERNFFQSTSRADQASLLYSVVAFVLIAFALTGAFTWIARSEVARLVVRDESQGLLVFAAFCGSAVSGVKAYYLLYFRNTDDARRYAWFSIDETVLGAVVSLTLVAWLRVGPIGLVLGQLTASTAVLLAVGWHVGQRFRPTFCWPQLKDALKISLPLTPRIFVGVVGANLDKYLIGSLYSVGGVGIYTIGQRIAFIAFQFMTAIENVFTPEVYRRMFGQDPAAAAAIGRYLAPFAYASASVGLLIALFAEEGLWLVAPAIYGPAMPVVALLTVSYALMFFGKLPQLTFARKTALTSALSFVSVGLNVGINMITVPRWGAIGAAAGTLLAGVLSGAIGFVVRQHYYPIQWQYGRIGAIFGSLAGFSLLMAVMPTVLPDYIPRLVLKLLCLAVFAWLGVRFGYLSSELMRSIAHRVPLGSSTRASVGHDGNET